MKQWMRKVGLAAALLPGLVGIGAPTQVDAKQVAGDYRFTVVADSTRNRFDPYTTGCAAINDKAQIAFRTARLDGTQIVFRSTKGKLELITRNPQPFSFIGTSPSINERGEVAFTANLDAGGAGVFLGSGGALTTIATTGPAAYRSFGVDTSLNNRGEVAFKATSEVPLDRGLFVSDGNTTRTYYLAAETVFAGSRSAPSLNDRGEVAFREFLDAGGQAIVRSNGRDVVQIADESGPLLSLGDVSINKRGLVAFDASLDAGGEAIFTGSGGTLTTIVSTLDGPIFTFDFGGPSLNDKGEIAFAATLDNGEQGVFTGPNPATDEVIGTGDALAGSTVSTVVFCREGLNNKGELAFVAQLADGRSVVVLATPQKGKQD